MEADFLLRMSDKTLPLLNENRDKFISQPFLKNENSVEILDQRIRKFLEKKEKHSFLSWNHPDDTAIDKLKNHQKH